MRFENVDASNVETAATLLNDLNEHLFNEGAHKEHPHPPTCNSAKFLADLGPYLQAMLLYDGNALAGVVTWCVTTDPAYNNLSGVFLSNIYFLEAFRGKGHLRTVLDEVLRREGKTEMFFIMGTQDQKALNSYDRLGAIRLPHLLSYLYIAKGE